MNKEQELKTADTMKMINQHNREKEIREEENKRVMMRVNKEKKIVLKELKRYGTVAAIAITIAGSALGVKAKDMYETLQGSAEITKEFISKTPSFTYIVQGSGDPTNGGPYIMIGTKSYVDAKEYEIAAGTLFETAVENGMSREEAYIGLKETTNKITAEKVYGKKLDNVKDICKNAYYKSKIVDNQREIDKGMGK